MRIEPEGHLGEYSGKDFYILLLNKYINEYIINI